MASRFRSFKDRSPRVWIGLQPMMKLSSYTTKRTQCQARQEHQAVERQIRVHYSDQLTLPRKA